MWSSAKGSYMRRAAGLSAGRLDQRPIPAPTNRLSIRRWVGPIRRRSRQNWFRFIDGPERAGSEAAAFAAIDEKIRANTRAVLDRAAANRVPPRAAAMGLAKTRIKHAMRTRRWEH
jgi:hypothetical protein